RIQNSSESRAGSTFSGCPSASISSSVIRGPWSNCGSTEPRLRQAWKHAPGGGHGLDKTKRRRLRQHDRPCAREAKKCWFHGARRRGKADVLRACDSRRGLEVSD